MATNEGAAAARMGQSPARRTAGMAGQYIWLGLLSLLVLGPIALTVIQALSPPFTYVAQGRPLHPVAVSWQDRTWFTGGIWSLAFRTIVVVLLLAWLQQVGSGVSWRKKAYYVPSRIVAVVGGTVVLAFAMGAVFQSLYKADGKTAVTVALAMVLVAATQLWGFASAPGRSPVSAVAMASRWGRVVTCTEVSAWARSRAAA